MTDETPPSTVASTGGDRAPDDFPPSPSSPARRSWRQRLVPLLTWSTPQRRAMIVPLAIVLGIMIWRIARDRSYISDPQPAVPARAVEIDSQLDPNTATWQQLVALPQLGEKRAQAIVEYRQERVKRRPGRPAFEDPYDLAAVKGIGASMIETLKPYLRFPPPVQTQPTK